VVFVLLLAASFVVAEQMEAYVAQPTTIATACIRNSQMRSNVNATITIFDENGSVLVGPVAEVPAGNGTFSYTYTFENLGSYTTRETCDFGGLLADGSTLITVVKPGFGNMQVIAQGVAQVGLGATAVSEWLILLPNATNQTRSALAVTGGSCIVAALNGSMLNATVNAVTTADKLTSTVVVDTVDGFQEGNNYQILCNITLTNGLYVNGVKNYVYVNEHVSFLQYILQLIGLGEQTQATVNQTLAITNQTLQIVQGLNNTNSGATIYEQLPSMYANEVVAYDGVQTLLTSKLTYGSIGNISDASCSVEIRNLVSGVVELHSASYDVVRQVYVYNWTPGGVGYYSAMWGCAGGLTLGSRVVYDVSSVGVVSGVNMVDVS
jgi:hypothetical protein